MQVRYLYEAEGNKKPKDAKAVSFIVVVVIVIIICFFLDRVVILLVSLGLVSLLGILLFFGKLLSPMYHVLRVTNLPVIAIVIIFVVVIIIIIITIIIIIIIIIFDILFWSR